MIEEVTGPGLTVTIKDGAGHDSSWYVVRGKSAAEVADIVGAIDATGLPALVANLKTTITALNALNAGFPGGVTPLDHPSTAQADYNQGQQGPPQGPPPAGPPTNNGAPSCPHGVKTWKTGVNKTSGKPWKAWMCPAPQGTQGQCPPDWK